MLKPECETCANVLVLERMVADWERRWESLKVHCCTIEKDRRRMGRTRNATVRRALDQRAEIRRLRSQIRVDDDRLRTAGERVDLYYGCDTAEAMADEIGRLRAQVERLSGR